ncbi:MAG TPA: DUF4097 family beta strand repeat-containing protein [Candidatus Binatia bacterium]|nr:DUF4097 family beta strand repeat-containing protein [Candidatus Binatia bacterium]
MAKERYETGKAPLVTVAECAGDVVVKGSLDNAVQIKGQHEADVNGDEITVRSNGSMTLMVPTQSQIVLQTVAGDAVVKGVEGSTRIEQVMGDLGLKGLGSIKIASVYGDMSARNIDGNLAAESVMGDAAARNVGDLTMASVHGDLSVQYATGAVLVDQAMGDINLQTIKGEVTLEHVRRDVNLNNLGGILTVEQADGDIRLKGSLAPGKHRCSAQGDIVLRWPADAPLNLEVSQGRVQDKLGLEDVSQQEGAFSGRLGDGETTLVLEAGGRVILKEAEEADWSGKFGAEFAGMGADFADIGAELAGLGEQLSSEFSAHMQELGARMEERFGQDFAQTMAEKAARRTERAVKRAMREAERVRARAATWGPPPPPPPRSKKSEQVSAEEQKKILSMLEKGVITVEEAETLLKALEE